MRAVVHAYVDGYSHSDLDAVLGVFADDATLEDPVGTEVRQGQDALRAFFGPFIETTTLELHAPIRCAGGTCAFAFTVTATLAEGRVEIDVVDVFEFNDRGKVASMKAYWGPDNMRNISDA